MFLIIVLVIKNGKILFILWLLGLLILVVIYWFGFCGLWNWKWVGSCSVVLLILNVVYKLLNVMFNLLFGWNLIIVFKFVWVFLLL